LLGNSPQLCHIAGNVVGQNGKSRAHIKSKAGMKRSPSSEFARSVDEPRTQYGAICWRIGKAGLDVLLITSRETGRWVIPKGWPIRGLSAPAAAGREAWEEAGVEGPVGKECLGVFSYQKTMPEDQPIPCAVAIYGLKVTKLSRRYPEQHQRRRKWFSAIEAASLVAEPELRNLLLALSQITLGPEPDSVIKKLKAPVPALPH
jgi:8-oxo-dGTP pyrophosphatase MutT (NUDIX family)